MKKAITGKKKVCESQVVTGPLPANGVSRRKFLGKAGGVTAAVAAASAGFPSLLAQESTEVEGIPQSVAEARTRLLREAGQTGGQRRRVEAFEIRFQAAVNEFRIPLPQHINNGDERLYVSKIGDFSKGLPHNSIGEVDLDAYSTVITAVTRGNPSDFENITLGGSTKLVNPQGGLAFDMEGADCAALSEPPSPVVASQERADEMVELYWMALARDVPFSQYGQEPITQAAIAELSSLVDFRGPKQNGQVTAQTLFRTGNSGDTVGPYISQFLLQQVILGAFVFNQRYNSYAPGVDYMTDFATYLGLRNGGTTSLQNVLVPNTYLFNGRGTGAWVHADLLFQAYFMGLLALLTYRVPFNVGNPYNTSHTQAGFGTFGGPHITCLFSEASARALHAQWFEKWFVHRALRPEEFGGLVQNVKTGVSNHPLHSDVLDSQALSMSNSRYGSWLLPQMYPEGCPLHPSYGSGHGTVAGACVTMLKAFFDASTPITSLFTPVYSPDGVSLVPYTGSDVAQMTVETELNKLAMNISQARNIAGIHWRSDALQANLLGEAVGISILRDQDEQTYNENFTGFTFNKFDGTPITI